MEFVQETNSRYILLRKKRKMSASTFSACFLAYFLTCSVSADQREIKAKPGDDVTLHCQGPKDAADILLKWRRTDMKPMEYVFFYSINRPYEYLHHPTVYGRVQLRDAEMKGGDVSVILKNVNIKDTGTYECHVSFGSKELELIDTVILKVEDSDQQEIKAKSGDDVTLHCRGPRDANITVLRWSRLDLKKDGYLFFFRDGRSHESFQHPSARGRVQLRDTSSMKDGDVSVILMNVTINDTGKYECHVLVDSRELMNYIFLKVEDSAHTAGNTEGDKDGGDKDGGDKEKGKTDIYNRVVVPLSVVGVVLVIVLVIAGVLIFIKYKSKKQISYESPAEKSDVNQV